jgi:predicted alpha/beta superfamily hydrolase
VRVSRHRIAALIVAMTFCFPATAVAGGDRSAIVSAVGKPTSVALGERVVIHSKILGEDRELLIHLPEHYRENDRRYPILVLLDGNKHFLHASGVVEFLSSNGRMPEMIVVAVPTMQRRLRDMTPPIVNDPKWKEENKLDMAGGADKFLAFLADEMTPWIDRHYRTEPYRVLMGHSLGGLFNMVALLDRPDAFQAHIAASPSLWWDQQRYVKLAEEGFGKIKSPHFLFLGWCDHEANIQESSENLTGRLTKNPPAGLEWHYRFYPGEDHGTTPHHILYDGLSKLFEGWMPDTEKIDDVDYPVLLAAHQAARSRKYGYAVPAQVYETDALAGWYLKKKRLDDALATARGNLDHFPDIESAYSRVSEVLDAMNRPAEALRYFRAAIKRPSEYGDVWGIARVLAEKKRRAAAPPEAGANP